MRWIAILRPQLGAGVSLAATSGAQPGTDVGQGADGRCRRRDDDVGSCSATVPSTSAAVDAELGTGWWTHEYESVSQLRGSASQATVEHPSAFERANYMQTLRSWVAPRGLDPDRSERPS